MQTSQLAFLWQFECPERSNWWLSSRLHPQYTMLESANTIIVNIKGVESTINLHLPGVLALGMTSKVFSITDLGICLGSNGPVVLPRATVLPPPVRPS